MPLTPSSATPGCNSPCNQRDHRYARVRCLAVESRRPWRRVPICTRCFCTHIRHGGSNEQPDLRCCGVAVLRTSLSSSAILKHATSKVRVRARNSRLNVISGVFNSSPSSFIPHSLGRQGRFCSGAALITPSLPSLIVGPKSGTNVRLMPLLCV